MTFKFSLVLFLLLSLTVQLSSPSEASPILDSDDTFVPTRVSCPSGLRSDRSPFIGPMSRASDFWIDWEIRTLLNSSTPNFCAVATKISYEDSRIGDIVASFGLYAEPAIFEALRSANPHVRFRAFSAIPQPEASPGMLAACADALGHPDSRTRLIAGGVLLGLREEGLKTLEAVLESNNGNTVQRWAAARALTSSYPRHKLAIKCFSEDFTKAPPIEQVEALPYFARAGIPLRSAMIASLHSQFDQMPLTDRVQGGLNLAAFGSDAAPFAAKIVQTFSTQEGRNDYYLRERGKHLLDALWCIGREGDFEGVQAIKSLIVETPDRPHAWYRDQAVVALQSFGKTALDARPEIERAATQGSAEAKALLVILGVGDYDLSAEMLGWSRPPTSMVVKTLLPSTMKLLGPRTLDAALTRLNFRTDDSYSRLQILGRLAAVAFPEVKRRLKDPANPDPRTALLFSVISPNQDDYLPTIIRELKDDERPPPPSGMQSTPATRMEDSIYELGESALPLLDALALTGDPDIQARADSLRESIKSQSVPSRCLALSGVVRPRHHPE